MKSLPFFQRFVDDRAGNFAALQRTLVDEILLILLLFSAPATLLSTFRALHLGWQPFMTLHIVGLTLLTVTWLLRRRLGYHSKILFILLFLFIATFSAMFFIGPAADGKAITILAAIIAMLFLAERYAWGVIALFGCTFLLLASAAINGWLSFTLHYPSYASHPTTWMLLIWVVIGYSSAVAWIAARMITYLRQHEAHYHNLIEMMSDGVVLYDRQGRIHSCNPAAAQLLGVHCDAESDTCSATGAWSAADPPDPSQPLLFAPIRATLSSGEPQHGAVVALHSPQGELRWLRVNSTPLPPPQPLLAGGVVATFSDITHHQCSESELRRTLSRLEQSLFTSEEHLRSLTSSMDDLVFTLDCAGRFESTLQAHSENLFLPVNAFLGKEYREVLPAAVAEQFSSALQQARAGTPQRIDYPMENKGDTHWYQASISARHNGIGHCIGFTAVVRDISSQKQTEQALRTAERSAQRARANAEEANHAKSAFLANMSHELRTPLNGVLGYAQLLSQDHGLRSEQRDALTTIKHSANQLLRLLNEVLDLTDLDSGGLRLSPAPFSLAELLEELLERYHPLAQARGMRLQLGGERLPTHIVADRKRIMQILDNLLSNALKFGMHGQIFLAGCADPIRANRIRLLLYVSDHGPGIQPSQLGNIFKPFHKVHNQQWTEGTGLGLSLCSALVRRMGGLFGIVTRVAGGRWVATDPHAPPPPDQLQGTVAWLRIEVETVADEAWMELSDIHTSFSQTQLTTTPPPPEQIAPLLHLCAAGDIDALLAEAEALQEHYPLFAHRLHELTETMQLDQLERWLQETQGVEE